MSPRHLLVLPLLLLASIASSAPTPHERMDQIARCYVDCQQFMGTVEE